MPDAVRDKIKNEGGFWGALVAVIPELARTARVVRRSTSAGISNADTGEQLPGSNGQHIFLQVQDGGDVERFLRSLHGRCWLAGFGWMMVGAGGQLLERSIVDRMVGAPERLVFEGAPVLDPPLVGKLEKVNGSASNLIARSGDYIRYNVGQPALALIDIDTKGMPPAVRDKIHAAGGFWAALMSVLPELETSPRA